MDEDPAREEIFHPAGQEAYVFGAISLVEVFLSLFEYPDWILYFLRKKDRGKKLDRLIILPFPIYSADCCVLIRTKKKKDRRAAHLLAISCHSLP